MAAQLAALLFAAQGAAAWVAIDVGHTLAAPGAISARGTAEFEFNLALARAVAGELNRRGTDARLVNADGLTEHLSDRGRAAQGAQLLISVHHDSAQPHFLSQWVHEGIVRWYVDQFSGFSLFISRKNGHLRKSLACASAVGREMRAGGFSPSLYHAERIAGEDKPFADRANGVHYYDNLVVLKSTDAPALLFEAGVILNRDEELLLQDPRRRAQMARSIAEGVITCLGSLR